MKKVAPESNLEETRKTTTQISAGRVVQAEGIADTKAEQVAVWKAAGSQEGLEPSEAGYRVEACEIKRLCRALKELCLDPE